MLFHALNDTAAARFALERQARVDSTGDYYRASEIFALSNADNAVLEAKLDSFPRAELSGLALMFSVGDLDFNISPNLTVSDSLSARAVRAGTAVPELERQLAWNSGRPSRAVTTYEERRSPQSMSDDVIAALMWDGDSTVGARSASELSAWLREHPSDSLTTDRALALFHQGLWAFNAGDTVTLMRARQSLTALKPPAATPWRGNISAMYDEMLGAHIAVARKNTDARTRLSHLDSVLIDTPGVESRMRSTLNTLMGELWERVGEPERALAANRRFDRSTELGHLSSVRMRRDARMLEQLGRPREAITAWRNYVALRTKAEPSLQPDLADAKANLARLEATVR